MESWQISSIYCDYRQVTSRVLYCHIMNWCGGRTQKKVRDPLDTAIVNNVLEVINTGDDTDTTNR